MNRHLLLRKFGEVLSDFSPVYDYASFPAETVGGEQNVTQVLIQWVRSFSQQTEYRRETTHVVHISIFAPESDVLEIEDNARNLVENAEKTGAFTEVGVNQGAVQWQETFNTEGVSGKILTTTEWYVVD